MKRYVIEFVHKVEETYKAVIEADSKSEALEIFEGNEFEFLESEIPDDVQGLEVRVIKVTERK